MIVASSDRTILLFNAKAEQAFGYERSEVVGQSFDLLVPHEYREAHVKLVRSFAEQTDPSQSGFRRSDIYGLRKDGSSFPAAAAVSKLTRGDDTFFVAVVRDVSEQKTLEARQRQLMSAIDAISEAVSVFDADDRYVFGNKRFCDLNRLAQDKLVPGTPMEDILSAIAERGGVREAIGREKAWVAERMKRHHENEGPFEIQRQNGWVLVTEQRLEDGGSVLLSADITRYKEADQQRRQAMEEMHRASLAKSEFLANISHELRTPLNAILGFSEILSGEQFGALGHDKYREYAKDIHASSRHLLMLVNDLLDISTIEAGEKTLTLEDVAVSEIVEECIHIVQNGAQQKNITLTTDMPPGEETVVADGRAIKQIVLNLLSNAVKFTPDDGRVDVSVSLAGGHCSIVVRDTGIGIPADRIPQLTDPFIRVEQDHYTAQEGTGLGLAIVDALVKLHDGTLTVESTVGEGTTVTVFLPN